MQDLSGRRALVTGASTGIGAATARALAERGVRVVALARRREALDELARSVSGIEPCVGDVRDPASLARALGDQPFDLAVVNAGLGRGMGALADGVIADWNEMIDTNIKGVLHTLKAVLPGMLARGRGDVVLLGSAAGRQIYPGGNVYCATKHAVRALYEALRIDHAGKGLRFTTVDPGMVETDFSVVRFKGDRERAAKVYARMTPLSAADVADVILFALTRPQHVNLGEIVMWPTEQASTTVVTRRPD